jgi:hypothetical protein
MIAIAEGLTVLFGDTPATVVQIWSANTLVVVLPPAHTPGPVLVSFKEVGAASNRFAAGQGHLPVFVYKDGELRYIGGGVCWVVVVISSLCRFRACFAGTRSPSCGHSSFGHHRGRPKCRASDYRRANLGHGRNGRSHLDCNHADAIVFRVCASEGESPFKAPA